VFPGGALVGCDAGTLNAARIKGSHAAIKTGMLAAEAIADALAAGRAGDELAAYPQAFEGSWLYQELHAARNFKQWFKQGNTIGSLMTGIEQWLLPRLGVKSPPWTIRTGTPDHARLHAASQWSRSATPSPTACSPSTA
jgi:electron-transferring-flavoprotein dehydrogenase